MGPRFIYLGLAEDGFLSGSMSALHVILWKFVLIAFTRVDTEGEEFKPDRVWRQAVRWWEVRLKAYAEGVRRLFDRRLDQGQGPPSSRTVERLNGVLLPGVSILDDGWLKFGAQVRDLLDAANQLA